MTLCRNCIEELKSRGERIYIGSMEMDYAEAVERDIGCDWCGERDDLYECMTEGRQKC